ncbi:MAG: 5-formyltetrahydrofolate cyclo-ligase [Candidatus Gastranaerophilales bacterium]
MKNKSDLRTEAKLLRKNLDIEGKSHIICEKIRSLKIYQNAKNVLIFYPMKYEINLLELLNDKKNFYLPKVDNKNLLACPHKSGDTLKKSELNIYEPLTSAIKSENLDLIIVPALIVDKKNYRLGYGGGFYDRFSAQNPQTKTITVIAQELLIDELPIEDCDVFCDFVVSA